MGGGERNRCYEFIRNGGTISGNNIHPIKGWFQGKLPAYAYKIESITMLRLDGDWYDSTKVCREYLYDKVNLGRVIIIDDYYIYDGCSKAVNEFWDYKKIKSYTFKVSNDCLFWIKSYS